MVKLTFHLQYVKHLASDAGSVNSDAGKVMESEEKPTSLKKKTEMPTRSNFLEKCLRISNFFLIVNFRKHLEFQQIGNVAALREVKESIKKETEMPTRSNLTTPQNTNQHLNGFSRRNCIFRKHLDFQRIGTVEAGLREAREPPKEEGKMPTRSNLFNTTSGYQPDFELFSPQVIEAVLQERYGLPRKTTSVFGQDIAKRGKQATCKVHLYPPLLLNTFPSSN